MPTMRTAPNPRRLSIAVLLQVCLQAKVSERQERSTSDLCWEQNCGVARFFAPILGTLFDIVSSSPRHSLTSALRITPTSVGTRMLTGSLRLHDHVLQPR